MDELSAVEGFGSALKCIAVVDMGKSECMDQSFSVVL